MNITILYGGKSTEHEVSLASASSVVRNISEEHNINLIGVSKANRFFCSQTQNLLELKTTATQCCTSMKVMKFF